MLLEHFAKMNGFIEKELVRKRIQMTLGAYFSQSFSLTCNFVLSDYISFIAACCTFQI